MSALSDARAERDRLQRAVLQAQATIREGLATASGALDAHRSYAAARQRQLLTAAERTMSRRPELYSPWDDSPFWAAWA